MRNDRPKKHWKLDWHARLTHQIGSRIDWDARLTSPSRGLALWQADGFDYSYWQDWLVGERMDCIGLASVWIACGLTKSRRHREILFATHLDSKSHSPLPQIVSEDSKAEFYPPKTPSNCKLPSFFPTFFEWIQIGVSHKKTATCPYRCNPPYLFDSRPLKVFMQDQNQKVKLDKCDDAIAKHGVL